MAIKIRCQDCSKKISIDEAFAGGMCRCPYCKALVYVEDSTAGGGGKAFGGARPVAPTHRPAAPGQAAPARSQAQADAEARAAADAEHVPMARPVKIQGIITIILLVLLVFMVGGGIALVMFYLPAGNNGEVPPPATQPGKIDVLPEHGPGVVDIKITPPVFYVLDGGSSMRSAFDSARLMVLKSVESLGDGKFNVIVAGEGQDKVVAPDLAVGGKEAAEKLTPVLQNINTSGAADIPRALMAAIARKPRTIVLFTRKVVDDAMSLAEQAKAQGTVIHTIVIDGDREVNESMKKLAEAAGGQARTFSPGGP
jgi:hypothetical protein